MTTRELCDRIIAKDSWFIPVAPIVPYQKQVVYISGPYTKGDVSQNVRNACYAANEVLRIGHIPFVPHLTHLWHLITPKPYEEWLEIDFALIPKMDAMLRLPGESKGADREVELARSLGIPVYYSIREIQDARD